MRYITAEQVVAIHERVILSHELQGIANARPVEAVIGRIENRLAYGLIGDVYDLAACYACYIAIGHCFHDANKRTAHTAMQIILKLNGIQLEYDIQTLGDMIIKAAQGIVEETELAAFLRSLPFIPIKEPGMAVHEQFKPYGGVELDLPSREPMREPPKFE